MLIPLFAPSREKGKKTTGRVTLALREEYNNAMEQRNLCLEGNFRHPERRAK